MLTREAKAAVQQARPQDGVSLVVFFHPYIDMSSLKGVKDVDQRLKQLDMIYRHAKQPIVDEVAAYAAGGLRVIDSSEGSPQLLLFGPAKTWRRLLKNRASLFSDPSIEVVANTMVGTTA